MSLRQKIQFTIGVFFAGLLLLAGCQGRPILQIAGGIIALDGWFLFRLWYRCPSCDRRLSWSAAWTFCPHCGAWIDYDAKK